MHFWSHEGWAKLCDQPLFPLFLLLPRSLDSLIREALVRGSGAGLWCGGLVRGPGAAPRPHVAFDARLSRTPAGNGGCDRGAAAVESAAAAVESTIR
jgi:hypothetical protein